MCELALPTGFTPLCQLGTGGSGRAPGETQGGSELLADPVSDIDRTRVRVMRRNGESGEVADGPGVASGMNGERSKARRLLADPGVHIVVVDHRDRLGRINTEVVESALSADGRRLVRDMVESSTRSAPASMVGGRRVIGH